MENKLNIQITVTDEQMASLIRGNLENLPDEKLQEIFSNALTEFLKTHNGQSLFYTKQYYSSEPKPTDLLVKMVSNAVSKDLLKPCVDEFIETLKGNYESLIKECMIKTFSNMFFTEMMDIGLQTTLHDMLDARLNNK
jgi:hypothetical protein